jgi:REP element-mobilizing transposase RayT
MTTIKKSQKNDLLYLLELIPSSDHIFEKIIVQNRLEQIFYQCAQRLDFTIDSCDIMLDYVAITLYINASKNIDELADNIRQQSSDLMIQEFKPRPELLSENSIWDFDYNLELIS